MNKDNTKYFSNPDIIRIAIDRNFQSKSKESNDLSIALINDMTYNNIWQIFTKWTYSQAEMGKTVNIHPFATISMAKEKLGGKVLVLRLLDTFLRENELTWDESKVPNLEKEKFIETQKLNIPALVSELNLPPKFVQTGLNNLFNSIAYLLQANQSCSIEMGILGSIISSNKFVSHIPMKTKNESLFMKKKTVKSMLGKYNNDPISKKQNDSQILIKSLASNDKLIPNVSQSANLKESKVLFDENLFKKPQKKKLSVLESGNASNLILVPITIEWNFKEIIGSTFKKNYENPEDKKKLFPNLFNEYSNTKAAPWTSEKTQIPLSHRIGSFYSLPLQNFIVDRTTKSIKTLYDEYFFRHKNIVFDLMPATEKEEYEIIYAENIDTTSIESKRVSLRKETHRRFQELYNRHIPDSYIALMKEKWLNNIVRLCMRAYDIVDQIKYDTLLNTCLHEITENYNLSIKKSILEYILKHPEQRDRLKIPISFRTIPEYGCSSIKRRSDDNWDWKRLFNLSKVRISNNLMIMGENITKILKYFQQSIFMKRYLAIPTNWDTEKIFVFVQNQKGKIEDLKRTVNDDWKKSVENILKENKIFKDQLILYFKSVSAVMSSQLRQIVVNSVRDFHDFIQIFKKESYFDAKTIFARQFKPEFPFQRSFLELDIVRSGDSFEFSEALADIHNRINILVNDVVKSSHVVERPDNLFIKNLDKKANLWEVQSNDQVITKMINNIDNIVKDNLDIINKVLDLYQPFQFILVEDRALEEFKSLNPTRPEIKAKIKKYEETLKTLRIDMPNSIYMNLIRIDCTEINKLLTTSLGNCINDLLKYVFSKNISNKSKLLSEEGERIKTLIGAPIPDEYAVSKIENEIEIARNEHIPKLKSDYRDFVEWIFFYLEFDIYVDFRDKSAESINSMDTIIKNTSMAVSYVVDHALEDNENKLKDKRQEFEKNLTKQREELNQEILKLKTRTEDIKAEVVDKIPSLGTNEDNLLPQIIDTLDKDIKDAEAKLKDIKTKEESLGAYPIEEDRVEQCKVELEPLKKYVDFVCSYQRDHWVYDNIDIKQIPFDKFNHLIENSNEIFENVSKLQYVRKYIPSFRNKYNDFRTGVEIGKSIFNLIEVVIKYESIVNEASKPLLDENNIYCKEFTKILFENDKGQEFLKSLKFKEARSNEIIKRYNTNKVEIENIISEWDNVKNIFDSIAKILLEVDISLKIENYKDKKYNIVAHSSYQEVREILNRNLLALDESMKNEPVFKYSDLNVTKRKVFRENLSDLKEIIEKMFEYQTQLEKYMEKVVLLRNKEEDSFNKFHQAEYTFTILTDFIKDHKKLMEIIKVKVTFKDHLKHIGDYLAGIADIADEE